MVEGQYLGLLDMLDGGGPGRAGQTFEGGPLSAFLNMLGIKPLGYNKRLSEARPAARPTGYGYHPAPPAPTPPAPTPPSNPAFLAPPVTTTSLPPLGQMSDEQLIALIRQAMQAAPSATGYGPR